MLRPHTATPKLSFDVAQDPIYPVRPAGTGDVSLPKEKTSSDVIGWSNTAGTSRQYEQLAKNSMKEVIMSTPAISDGVIIVRTLGHVYGIGEPK
jgi:hypothetical protein